VVIVILIIVVVAVVVLLLFVVVVFIISDTVMLLRPFAPFIISHKQNCSTLSSIRSHIPHRIYVLPYLKYLFDEDS